MPLARALGDDYALGEALIERGVLAFRQGDLDRAVALSAEASDVLRRVPGDMPAALPLPGVSVGKMGDFLTARGDATRAARCYAEVIDRRRAAGFEWGLAEYLAGSAHLRLTAGDPRGAAHLLIESLQPGVYQTATCSAFTGLAATAVRGFEADGTAMVEWVLTGTYDGQLGPLPPGAGQAVEIRVASVLDLEDGKLASGVDYWDLATLLSQVGALGGEATPAGA